MFTCRGAFFWNELLRSDAAYLLWENLLRNVHRRCDIHTNNIQLPGHHRIYEKDGLEIGELRVRQ